LEIDCALDEVTSQKRENRVYFKSHKRNS